MALGPTESLSREYLNGMFTLVLTGVTCAFTFIPQNYQAYWLTGSKAMVVWAVK